MPEDISAAERMINEWQQHANERAQKFDAMREQVEQISVTESSRDGSVSVTVNAKGLLNGLDLSESAGNRSMSQLSAEIMRAVRKAQSRIPDLMEQAVTETVGDDDSAGQHVLGEARRNFPEPPEDPDEAPPSGAQERNSSVEDESPQQRRHRPGASGDDYDDDDFSGGSFLR